MTLLLTAPNRLSTATRTRIQRASRAKVLLCQHMLMGTTFEQFLNILGNAEARRRVGIDLSAGEAQRVASDLALARSYYEKWCRRGPLPAVPRASEYPVNGLRPNHRKSSVTQASATPVLAQKPVLVPASIAAGLSLLAIFAWPYGYYQLLRFVLSATAVLIAVHAVRSANQRWFLLAIPMFLLWAPAGLVTLDRPVWAVLNVLAAIGLVCAGWLIHAPDDDDADGKRRWSWWQIALLVYGVTLILTLVMQPFGAAGADPSCELTRSGSLCG